MMMATRFLFYREPPWFFFEAQLRLGFREASRDREVRCTVYSSGDHSLFLSCDPARNQDSGLIAELRHRLLASGRFRQPLQIDELTGRTRTGLICFRPERDVFHIQPFLGQLRRSQLKILGKVDFHLN